MYYCKRILCLQYTICILCIVFVVYMQHICFMQGLIHNVLYVYLYVFVYVRVYQISYADMQFYMLYTYLSSHRFLYSLTHSLYVLYTYTILTYIYYVNVQMIASLNVLAAQKSAFAPATALSNGPRW